MGRLVHRLLVQLQAITFLCIAMPVANAYAAWTQNGFQIGGFAFTAAPADTAMLKKINALGVDWLFDWYNKGHATLPYSAVLTARLDQLAAADPTNFKLKTISTFADSVPQAGRLWNNDDSPPSLTAISTTLTTGGINTASTLGWVLWDEPVTAAQFQNAAVISRHIDSTQTKLPFVNLLASYIHNNATICNSAGCPSGGCAARGCPYYNTFGAGVGNTKDVGYKLYLDAYLGAYSSNPRPAPVLCFDHYRFQNPQSPWNDFFSNLQIAKEKASEYSRPGYRIPLWLVTQLSAFNGDLSLSIAKTRWQVYGALAYGAKGVSYWLLTSAHFDTVSAVHDDWAPGVLADNGDTVAVRYSQLRELNRDLHKLGPTLMNLDAVTTFHKSALDQVGIDSEVLGSADQIYDIVKAFGGQSDSVFAGHLKDRTNGDDYLLVVNKALVATQSPTVVLTHAADAIYKINRSTGAADLVALSDTTIPSSSMTLAPGQGELFRIVDKIYEYIPYVNVIATDGSREYYGHQKGVAMVDRATSRRTLRKDGTVFTPVCDLAITNSHVFIAQNPGPDSGSVVRTNLDLSSASLFRWTAGRPLGVTAQKAESSIVILDRISTTSSRLRMTNGFTGDTASIAFDNGGVNPTPYVAYDVHYLEGLKSVAVAHGGYYSRILAVSPYTSLAKVLLGGSGTADVNLTSIGTGLTQKIYAGRDEGTVGRLDKMNYNFVRPSPNGYWPAGGTSPSFKAVDARGNHVLFGSTSPSGDYFVRLRALDLASYSPYKLTSLPRAVALTSDSVALMANAAGVYRSSQTNLSGTYLVEGGGDSTTSRPDSLDAVRLELALVVTPNPVADLATFRFVIPQSGFVEMAVFDVAGRRLKTLVRGIVTAGEHSAGWKVPGHGVYFARLKSAQGVRTARIIGR